MIYSHKSKQYFTNIHDFKVTAHSNEDSVINKMISGEKYLNYD